MIPYQAEWRIFLVSQICSLAAITNFFKRLNQPELNFKETPELEILENLRTYY